MFRHDFKSREISTFYRQLQPYDFSPEQGTAKNQTISATQGLLLCKYFFENSFWAHWFLWLASIMHTTDLSLWHIPSKEHREVPSRGFYFISSQGLLPCWVYSQKRPNSLKAKLWGALMLLTLLCLRYSKKFLQSASEEFLGIIVDYW